MIPTKKPTLAGSDTTVWNLDKYGFCSRRTIDEYWTKAAVQTSGENFQYLRIISDIAWNKDMGLTCRAFTGRMV